jgi:hypothetical protein
MVTSFVIQRHEYTQLEPGIYDAKIVGAEVSDNPFEPGKQRLTLTLDLGGGIERRAYCNTTLGPKSTLARWLAAIYGNVPDELDIQDLIGVACRCMIVSKTTKDGRPTDAVTELLAPKKQQPKPQPVVEEEPMRF